MKKKIDLNIFIIIILSLILILMCFFYLKDENVDTYNTQYTQSNTSIINSKILTTTGETESGLTENIELHATYYFEECYVEVNEEVKKR